MKMISPYLNKSEAAAYLRYSEEHFRDIRKVYNIPAKGPKGTRFHVRDLDAFMDDPNAFKKKKNPTRRKIENLTALCGTG